MCPVIKVNFVCLFGAIDIFYSVSGTLHNMCGGSSLTAVYSYQPGRK